jgi:hypothetical protein
MIFRRLPAKHLDLTYKLVGAGLDAHACDVVAKQEELSLVQLTISNAGPWSGGALKKLGGEEKGSVVPVSDLPTA